MNSISCCRQAISREVMAKSSAMRVVFFMLLLLLFLQLQQLALDHVGDAEQVLPGNRLAIFLQHQRAEHLLALAAAGDRVGLDAGEHLLEIGAGEERFEVLGHFLDAGFIELPAARRVQRLRRAILRERARIGDGVRRDPVHCVTMSACRAPAALTDCRIEIRSRGPTPNELMPVTSCSSVTLAGRTASFRLLSSCTWMSVRGTT